MMSSSIELWEQVRHAAPSCANGWMIPGGRVGLVSVVVPTYNRAYFLLDCLQSVLHQTHRPIEMILVDDGSTDSTAEVVERWKSSLHLDHGFSFVFIRQENQGANVARNRGLLESHGEYIQFLDSDDLLLPDKLRVGIGVIQKNGADYAYCPVQFRDEDLRTIPGEIGSPLTGTDVDITTYLWQTMCPVYCRELVRRVGPWLETIFHGDDWEYACRVKLLTQNGVYYGEAGGLLRIHPRPERSLPKGREREYRDYHVAYTSVMDVAGSVGHLTPIVRERLARRFLLNALFFGGIENLGLRVESLDNARRLFPLPFVLSLFIRMLVRIRFKWLEALAANLIPKANQAKGKAPSWFLRALWTHLGQSIRMSRMRMLRRVLEFRSSPLNPTAARCVILLPHPDDEVFGMGGTIAAKTAVGAECVFVLATWGDRSHCDCCPGAEDEVTAQRRKEFQRSLIALGVGHSQIIELGLMDDELLKLQSQDYARARDRIAAILSEVSPQEVYYPARQDTHPDHMVLSKLCREAVDQSGVKCRELRYIVWGWFLPSKKFFKELVDAKILKVDARPWAVQKRQAIDVYLKSPPAPCGVPYCGGLPPVLLEAVSSTQEIFLS